MELKAENGLIYQRDGDGWTVAASCLSGAQEEAEALAETLVNGCEKAALIAEWIDLLEQRHQVAVERGDGKWVEGIGGIAVDEDALAVEYQRLGFHIDRIKHKLFPSKYTLEV